MDPGVPDDSDSQKYGITMIFQGWLLEKGAFFGKFDDFFCGFPPISASLMENWDLIFYYQILLIKWAIIGAFI